MRRLPPAGILQMVPTDLARIGTVQLDIVGSACERTERSCNQYHSFAIADTTPVCCTCTCTVGLGCQITHTHFNATKF